MNLKSLVERVDWRLLLIFILVAAIVHVLETFLAVNDQRNAAYARLARELPHNTMTIADPVTPRTPGAAVSGARCSLCILPVRNQ